MTIEQSQLISTLIVVAVAYGIPLMGALLYLIRVLMKLNRYMLTIEMSQNHQGEHLEEHGQRLNQHEALLNEHTTDIKLLQQRRAL